MMKAVFYTRHGEPGVLQTGELSVPIPEATQVLVQVAATSVNPIDRRLRAGELQEYIARTFPVVPGWDLSGRIVEVGSEAEGWSVGDEVVGLAFTWSIQHGTYAEYVPVDVSSIAAKPVHIEHQQAAALPLVSLTAWQALAEYGELKSGQSVFIQAGAGGVGSMAIQMAKHLGATVYTTASAKNTGYVKSLGADHVIDYREISYADYILSHEPNGVDLVLESLLGDGIAETAIKLARNGGVVVYMNNEPPDMPEIKSRAIKTQFLHHRADGEMLEVLMSHFADGAFQLPAIEVLPLEQAREAHIRSEANRTRGKLVLKVADLA